MTNIPAPSGARPSYEPRHKKLWRYGSALPLVVMIGTGAYLVDAYWPFRYRNVEPLLENVFASRIKISQYRRTYFPRPGFVAVGITLRRKSAPDLPPVGSADKLIVQGSWTDLLMLRARVRLVDVTGLHVVIPPLGSRAIQEDFPPGSSTDFSGPTPLIEQFNLHLAMLDILRNNGSRYSFPIRQLVIRNLQMESDISHVTTGFQSLLLKPLVPFFKRGKAGAVIPIAITGGPGNYKITQDLRHNK